MDTNTLDTEKTIVVFRKWKDTHDVIALFPGIPETRGMVQSYMHVGQHAGADYAGVIKATTPAEPRDYMDLLAELTSSGYNLEIRERRTT